ncbi:MAG: pyridoxal-phosphate dependent enzyme [Ferruginibacter sp.]
MKIEIHNDVYVLRDDLLPGGTKSIFLPSVLDNAKDCFVYASPVYGGMQIALALYATSIGKKAVIFSAKRNKPHANSLKVKEASGLVYQVPVGYLTVCQARAREYAEKNNGQLISFGANYPAAIDAIAARMKQVTSSLGFEPDEIFCAAGSGTLLAGIVQGTATAKVKAVQVGAELPVQSNERVSILPYHKPFEYESRTVAPFPSCANYDLKAWEYCLKYKTGQKVLFWNVL